MKLSLFIFITFCNIQFLFGQEIDKINGTWIQYNIEKRVNNQYNSNQVFNNSIFTKYCFSNLNLSIQCFTETLTNETSFDIKKNILHLQKPGAYYQIEVLNDSLLIIKDFPNPFVSDDKINRYYFMRESKYYEYIIKNNKVKINGDTLILANKFLSPNIDFVNSISNNLNDEFPYHDVDGIAIGYFIISPQSNIINAQITRRINLKENYEKRIIKVINKTSGKWNMPKLGKDYNYKIDFSAQFTTANFWAPKVYYFSKDTTLFSLKGNNHIDKVVSDRFFNKGLSSAEKHKYDIAVVQFSNAIKFDSTSWDAYFNRAYCNYQIQKVKDACLDWLYLKNTGQKKAEELFIDNCKDFDIKKN